MHALDCPDIDGVFEDGSLGTAEERTYCALMTGELFRIAFRRGALLKTSLVNQQTNKAGALHCLLLHHTTIADPAAPAFFFSLSSVHSADTIYFCRIMLVPNGSVCCPASCTSRYGQPSLPLCCHSLCSLNVSFSFPAALAAAHLGHGCTLRHMARAACGRERWLH